jgi:hypothetical protein
VEGRASLADFRDPHHQWTGGGDVDIWHVEEAPTDPADRSGVYDQHREDAGDAFGSVAIVHATSPEAAAERARQEARETSERIHREVARKRSDPRRRVAHRW